MWQRCGKGQILINRKFIFEIYLKQKIHPTTPKCAGLMNILQQF